jgi:hypothetical protein
LRFRIFDATTQGFVVVLEECPATVHTVLANTRIIGS